LKIANEHLPYREEPAKLGNAGEAAMSDMIEAMTIEATGQIDNLLAAMFGKEGHKQDEIPLQMRVGV
jgi:hypothetical protein